MGTQCEGKVYTARLGEKVEALASRRVRSNKIANNLQEQATADPSTSVAHATCAQDDINEKNFV
jgi:hypothetical protein